MKIFLSYRRADSQVTAGRMAQFLDAVPAVDEVFLDVDGIAPGENFETRIQETLQKVSHVFVLIGPLWRGPSAGSGPARILEPDDMVRREVRLALASGRKLVPVLLDGTVMPRASELPPDLRPLASINAFALRTAQFDEDMDDLLDAVAGNRLGRGSRWRQAPLTPGRIALRMLAGLAGAAVLVLALAVLNQVATGQGLANTLQSVFGISQEADAVGLMWMLVLGVLGAGAVAPFVPRWLRRKG